MSCHGLGPILLFVLKLSRMEVKCHRLVTCGAPQGSVLGPLLVSTYTRPLEQVIKRHNPSFNFYADDTQLYLSFGPSEAQSALTRLKNCLSDIRDWMAANFLKVNNDRTELVLISNPKRL